MLVKDQKEMILGSTSIRYGSDTNASDRYLIDTDPIVFAIWAGILVTSGAPPEVSDRKMAKNPKFAVSWWDSFIQVCYINGNLRIEIKIHEFILVVQTD